MKFYTPVDISPACRRLSLSDGVALLGSCFADSVGEKMLAAGFSAMVNPFGTLYNPASILGAVRRLDGTDLYTPADCVPMGAGAGRICSWEHHTSFARATEEEFLQNANAHLQQAREQWRRCTVLILTLGTSFVWEHEGRTVANCLKRPAAEFTRRMLSAAESAECLRAIASAHPEKQLILTVSPIRHLSPDGAHANTLSKANLHLATQGFNYFPAYELILDELRDYRFYAEDLLHPSPAAVQYIWEKFLEAYVDPKDLPIIATNEKAARREAHRCILK